ncbi:LPS translocon maturation chaperone LptM [Bergeriella denitrificans]|nr:lipoprotein [Bergeriella denitrificans]
MKSGVFFAALSALLLAACGFKGNLYLPKEDDKAKFGVIQTGLPIFQPSKEPRSQAHE